MRIDMVNAEIQRELASIINFDMKDPRLTGMVTVLRVETTADLSFSKIYLSIMGDEETRQASFIAIKSGTSYLRRELAHRIRVRVMPDISFILDDSIEYSIKISKIIDKINSKNKDANNNG